MSAEENKTLVRRFFEEFLSTGNAALLEELVAADCVFYSFAIQMDRAGAKQLLGVLRTGFPDLHFQIEELIVEGDKVVARYTMRGSHQGEFQGIPPTGKQFTVTGMGYFRVVNEKIVENRFLFDQMGLMQLLGVVPPSVQGGS